MSVIIRFYGILKERVKERLEIEIGSNEISFQELIKKILEEYPSLGEYIEINREEVVVKGVTILVNGRHIVFIGGEKAIIRDGDEIDILPPLHGGQVRSTH